MEENISQVNKKKHPWLSWLLIPVNLLAMFMIFSTGLVLISDQAPSASSMMFINLILAVCAAVSTFSLVYSFRKLRKNATSAGNFLLFVTALVSLIVLFLRINYWIFI